MKKTETLKDGTRVGIGELTMKDLDRSHKFFMSLPPEDRKYFKIDVANKDILARKLRTIETGRDYRIIAQVDDDIIAHGVLEFPEDGWRANQVELRVFVSREFQRKGLGMIMMRELYLFAMQRKVKKTVVKMMRPQTAARNICRKLGFREELMLPDYVVDQTGESQDLVIMTCNVEELWKEIGHFYQDSDWQRCR